MQALQGIKREILTKKGKKKGGGGGARVPLTKSMKFD